MTQRVNCSDLSLLQRAVKRVNRRFGSPSMLTQRPARPRSCWRAKGALRKKLAASSSLRPRRLSRLSAVSLERVTSARNRTMGVLLLLISVRFEFTFSSTSRNGNWLASGPKLATAKAPPPNTDKATPTPAMNFSSTEWVGFAAATLTTLSFAPQALIKSVKTQKDGEMFVHALEVDLQPTAAGNDEWRHVAA